MGTTWLLKAFSYHGARSASRTGWIEKDKLQKWRKKSQKQQQFEKAVERNATLVVAFVTAVACFWVYVGVTMRERGSNVVLQSSLAMIVFVIYSTIVVSGVITFAGWEMWSAGLQTILCMEQQQPPGVQLQEFVTFCQVLAEGHEIIFIPPVFVLYG